MLHHGDIALRALFFKFSFVFFYVTEFNLLVFFLSREYGRPCEGGIKSRFTGWFIAVSDQLQIELGRYGFIGPIGNIVSDFNRVTASFKGIGFDQLHVIGGRRLKAKFNLVVGLF